MATVALDREQREGIRSEIRVVASRFKDITKCLQPDRDGNTDRASVVRNITELVQWVAMLDAIGWQEPAEAPNEFVVTVDSELAMWARRAARELERAFERVLRHG